MKTSNTRNLVALSLAALILTITSAASAQTWTSWMNRDDPGASGDWEDMNGLHNSYAFCDNPIDIQCETVSGTDFSATGENFLHPCTLSGGLVCRNADQSDGSCQDYQVRVLCPPQGTGACCAHHPFTGQVECFDGADWGKCDANDGLFHPGLSCQEVDCPNTGACCAPHPVSGQVECFDGADWGKCDANGGVYHLGMSCQEVDCPTDGACCIEGECLDNVPFDECNYDQDEFFLNETCDPNTCSPVAPCCADTCYEAVTQAFCDSVGGNWNTSATGCSMTPMGCLFSIASDFTPFFR